jgi:hypothetical protein
MKTNKYYILNLKSFKNISVIINENKIYIKSNTHFVLLIINQ